MVRTLRHLLVLNPFFFFQFKNALPKSSAGDFLMNRDDLPNEPLQVDSAFLVGGVGNLM